MKQERTIWNWLALNATLCLALTGCGPQSVSNLDAKPKACFFRESGYTGEKICYGEGTSIGDLEQVGFKDRISSVQVDPGLRVSLFKYKNFEGPHFSTAEDADEEQLGELDNDTVSLRVEENPDPAAADTRLLACLYRNKALEGRRFCLTNVTCTGLPCQINSLGAAADMNNKVSSLQLYAPLKLTLFMDENATGTSREFTQTAQSLDTVINDEASSVRLEQR